MDEPRFEDHILHLKRSAIEEEIAVNPASERDMREFIADLPEPGIVLLNGGNFRAIWHDGAPRVGVEFRGDGTGRYVLFRVTARTIGEDSLEAIRAIVQEFLAERVVKKFFGDRAET